MGFLQALRRPEMRKLFGKRELVILEKQAWGVALSQSEKNRLSRDIRKKFEAVQALAPFSEEFRLKKGSETRKQIEEAKEVILESPLRQKIMRIVVYGSFVENRLTLSSDIDVAVEFLRITLREATQFRKQVLAKTGSRVDVQVYNFLPLKLKKEVDAKGRTIYAGTHPR